MHHIFVAVSTVLLMLLILNAEIAESQSFCQSVTDLNSLATSDLIFYRQLQSLRLNFSRIASVQQKIEKANQPRDSFPPKLRSFLDDFEASTGYTYTILDHPTNNILADNPIAVYRMIRRIVSATPEIVKLEKYGFAISIQEHRKHFDGRWPSLVDVEEAIDSILQLHHVYNLNVTEFSEGIIFGVPTGFTLEALHCYEIGMQAKKSKFHTLAVEWLELSLQKLSTVPDSTVAESEVVEALKNIIQEHDEDFGIVDLWNPFFFAQKIQSTVYRRELRVKRRDLLYSSFRGRSEFKYNHINYWALCSGETLQSEKVKSQLFCWLERKASKALLIGPLKMELLARNPDVVQIYELVGDEEIEKIKNNGFERLKDHTVTNFEINSNRESASEVGKRDWETRNSAKSKEILSVSKKLKSLTGFEVSTNNSADSLHVASYSFAGHYDPSYYTYLSEYSHENQVNHFATLMIWLSDVQLGGYTVFPSLLVAGKPLKGSALLHYNTHKDGSRDYLSSYQSCPVVLGQKWSASTTMSSNDPFLSRKCRLPSKERFHVSVNGIAHRPVISNSDAERDGSNFNDEHQLSSLQLKHFSYGSVPGMKTLAQEEENIYNFIKPLFLEVQNGTCVDKSCRETKILLDSYVKDYEDTTGKLTQSVDGKENGSNLIAHNLLASYKMIWRFRTYLRKLLWSNQSIGFKNRIFDKIVQYLQRSFGMTDWPDKVFLEDAITGILVIQHIHDLQAANIASGLVNGVENGITLNAAHSYEIGKFALSHEYYSLGVEWMELATVKLANGTDFSIDNVTVTAELKKSIKIHNQALSKSAGWEPLFYTRPVFLSNDQTRIRRKVKQYSTFKLQEDPDLSEINYWGVCSGKPHQTEEQKSKLFCWYESEVDPFWKINPLKVEIHSMRPKLEIVQYYDVLSNSMNEKLKMSASPNLKKSPLQSFYNSGVNVNSNWRLSVQSSIPEESSESNSVSRTVLSITGLNVMEKQENLEIASYTPGGHYNVHLDSVGYGEGISGSRIGSVLFSLSDVENGGDIAFAQAGVRIKPVKGSAIFWYNLLRSGDLNDYSWHGICPVTYGEYWVATKWINYEEQIFSHTCGPDRQETHEILVNGRSKYAV